MKIAPIASVAVLMSFSSFAVIAAPVENFEVRLVVECARGMATFEFESQDETKPAERLCVSPDVIMNHQDVVKVAKTQRDKYEGPILVITYSNAAKARMFQTTNESVGHRIAIMAHGKVLLAPVILDPISGNSIIVTGRVADLDRLLGDLTNGSRPL
jgi:preprotein translocase subunit SecD